MSIASLRNPVPKLILFIGALLLFSYLDIKPPQHDEGVNGWLIEEVIYRGHYPYDPTGYHGPLYFYILFIFKLLFGQNLWALRLPAVLFSLATIWLFLKLKPYVGRWSAYTLAMFAAVSPGVTFYSRYAIHESTLYFFSVLMLLGFFRYCEKKDKSSLWLLGLGFTGMLVTKETYVITLASFFGAWFFANIYQRWAPATDFPTSVKKAYSTKDRRWVLLACVWITLLLYTGFFQNLRAIFYTFGSLKEWVTIGVSEASEQQGHWKYFGYWVELFSVYEWIALSGVILSFRLFATARWSHRIIGFYGLLNLLIYSAIRYKTPWCILQLIWPFLFVAASALEEFAISKKTRREIALVVIILLTLLSAWRAMRLNFYHYEDEKEPYVHVQTFSDIVRIHTRITNLVQKNPEMKHMTIHVIMKAYWPISWMFNEFSKTFYYTKFYPIHGDGGVIFCEKSRRHLLELKLKKSYFTQSFKLNPVQEETFAYFDTEIFKDYFDENTPRFEPTPLPPAKFDEGLLLTLFHGADWQGEIVRQEKIESPVWEYDDGESRPLEDAYSATFEGEIFVPQSGNVTFFLSSDDGSEVVLDGEVLIDNLGEHQEKIESQEIFVEAGWHSLFIKYFDLGGAQAMRLWWQLPGRYQEAILPEYLHPKKVKEKV